MDDGKPKKMTWRLFRPAPKRKPEPAPSVKPQTIILVPRAQQKPVSSLGSPLQPKRGPIAAQTQNPASTLGSPLQPKRGPITGPPITGNPNLERGGQIPRRTANLGPWQATISNTCITCLIISIIVLAILFLLTLACSIFALVVFLYNGDAGGNWNRLTTFEAFYEDEPVEDTADRDY